MKMRQAGEVDRIAAREFHCAPFTAAATWTIYEIAAKTRRHHSRDQAQAHPGSGRVFHQLLTPAIPTLSRADDAGLVPHARTSRADIVGAFTNCMPTDAYRGAGRPEATHGIERMVDMLAAELKMDPGRDPPEEFRRATRSSRSPRPPAWFTTRGDYAAPLKKAMEMVGYDKLREEQSRRRASRASLMGIGMSRVWRDLRVRPLAGHARRRLGKRHGEDRAVGHRSRS